MSSQLLFQGLLLGVIAWIAISEVGFPESCDAEGSSYLQKAQQQGVLNFMVNAGGPPPTNATCDAFPDDSFPFPAGQNCKTTDEDCSWLTFGIFNDTDAAEACWFSTVDNNSNFCDGNPTENFTNQVTAQVVNVTNATISVFVCFDVPEGLCPTVVCVKAGNDRFCYDSTGQSCTNDLAFLRDPARINCTDWSPGEQFCITSLTTDDTGSLEYIEDFAVNWECCKNSTTATTTTTTTKKPYSYYRRNRRQHRREYRQNQDR